MKAPHRFGHRLWVGAAPALLAAGFLLGGAAAVLGLALVGAAVVAGYASSPSRATHRTVHAALTSGTCPRCGPARGTLAVRRGGPAVPAAWAPYGMPLAGVAGPGAPRPGRCGRGPAWSGVRIGDDRNAHVVRYERRQGEGVEHLVEAEPPR
ncbi:hypothetical protein GCM10027168_23070 [Streptomyces capparidis]